MSINAFHKYGTTNDEFNQGIIKRVEIYTRAEARLRYGNGYINLLKPEFLGIVMGQEFKYLPETNTYEIAIGNRHTEIGIIQFLKHYSIKFQHGHGFEMPDEYDVDINGPFELKFCSKFEIKDNLNVFTISPLMMDILFVLKKYMKEHY